MTTQRVPFISRRELYFFCAVALFHVLVDCLLLSTSAHFDMFSRRAAWPFPAICLEGFVIGGFFSQVVVLAIWTALFPGAHLLRIGLGALTLTASGYFLAYVSTSVSLDGYVLRGITVTVSYWQLAGPWLILVVIFLIVQVPFWLLRQLHGTGIRMVLPVAVLERGGRQFALLDVFGLTAFIAAALVVAKPGIEVQGVVNYLLISVPLMVLSLVYGCVYLWVSLGTPRPGIWLVGMLPFTASLAALGAVTYSVIYDVPTRQWAYVLAAFAAVQVATLTLGLGTGLAARAVGYRLAGLGPGDAADHDPTHPTSRPLAR